MSLIKTKKVAATADSAEFKKGDKVVSRSAGVKGVVEEVYGNGQYAVLFEGAKNPDRIGAERIKAADSAAMDDDASDVKFAKEQLAVFQGISTSVARFRMTTPNGTKFAKAYRLAKEILDSVYEIETELKRVL